MNTGKTIYPFAPVFFALGIFQTEKCMTQTTRGSVYPDSVKPFFSGASKSAGNGLVISELTYDKITKNGVTLYWQTDLPADSKIKWMVADSNDQPLSFTDSIENAAQVTNHAIPLSNLKPATIYKYNVISQNRSRTK
jgi:hypothetical protein